MSVSNPTSRLVQTVRVDLGVRAAAGTYDVAITWPVPFPDTNYVVTATIVEQPLTANSHALRQVGSLTPSGCTVKFGTSSAAGWSGAGQGFLHVTATHD